MSVDETVDPKAAPGSYEKTQDGFVLLEERTAAADLETGHPALELESAQAIAAASEASGFPPPPQVQAVIDAAAAQDKATQAAERALARAAAKAPPAAKPEPATAPSETKE